MGPSFFIGFAWLQLILCYWLFCKGVQGPLVCVYLASFFFLSIYLTSYTVHELHILVVFFPVEQLFLLQLSVSPDCSSLRAERRRRGRGGGGGEKGSWVKAEWEGVGRGQEIDCEKKSKISYLQGLDDCCIFKVSFRYLLYFWSQHSGIFSSKTAGLYLSLNECFEALGNIKTSGQCNRCQYLF